MTTHHASRRGAILLVVLALLTLFAVVGLSFVLYADAASRSARLYREAQSPQRPDVESDLLLSYFLGQLLYDAPDDASGAWSVLRGHSLARNLYGASNSPGPPSPSWPTRDTVPFSGTGRQHAPSPFGTTLPGPAVDDFHLINYTYYPQDPQLPAGRGFLRDPERLGWRPANLAAPRGAFDGGFNVPYTYPDLHNTFLAAVRADGAVLLPSFHRPWTAAVPGTGLTAEAGEFFDRATGRLNPFWSAQPPALPPWFKYTTLRPLPALNPGFPAPEDGGGDVKNLVGGPGTFRRLLGTVPEFWNNDSFWMDLGFPVLTAQDGRRYKPLFAPLVVDLDNRVNANVHGNVQGPRGQHFSNQGWGPWEVNLSHVLPNGAEWRSLLRGSLLPPQQGRFGGPPGRGMPGVPGEFAPPGDLVHVYSQVDFDGRNEQTGGPSSGLLLPGLGGPPGSCFPAFLTPAGGYAGYGNRAPAECANHPLLSGVLRPAGPDRPFAVSDLEALLRYGDTGSPALTSDLFRLCPTNFADRRVRGLMTTHSFDLSRPGAAPWVHTPDGFPYDTEPTLDPDQPAAAHGPPIARPAPATGLSPQPPLGGEFGVIDGRSVSATLGRIDLSRPLPPYPHMGSGKSPPFGSPLTSRGGQPATDVPFNVDAPAGPIWKQFVLAQTARQQLADDVYRRLLAVAGVAPVRADQGPQAPPPELLKARRWLAQLAVNIVDFLDEDEISTPFCFYTAADCAHLAVPPPLPPDPDRVSRPDSPLLPNRPDLDREIQWPVYWVFGTELPRLVVNEALAEIGRSDADDAYRDRVRVFVELHNPLPRAIPNTSYQADSWPVPLQMGGGAYAPYRLVVGVKAPGPVPTMGSAVLPGVFNDNVLGNPEPVAVRQATTTADFAGAPGVPAHGPPDSSLPQGFFLLGPPPSTTAPFADFDPFMGNLPPLVPVLRTPSLEYVRSFTIPTTDDPPDERSGGVSVLLRRLANPYLPFDPQRTMPGGAAATVTYNPYVTVDFLEAIPLQPVEQRGPQPVASVGRLQPYAAHRSQVRPQNLQQHPTVLSTFGGENLPAPDHFDWLTHLDRRPSSPLELLHVSGYQPYQLTQRFVCPNAQGQVRPFCHRAPWLDEDKAMSGASHRLYRLFEFLETGGDLAGLATGGRTPGRINLNTVWDRETLRAICDPQPATAFGLADVDDLFARRFYDPSSGSAGSLRRTPGTVPGPEDRPFKGFAAGTYPPGTDGAGQSGVEDSLLRLSAPAGGSHPYLAAQLLTKLAGQVTTRSNLFAVWLTVGFFEVTDDTTRPVRLGAEIGRAENRHVRHRLFAVLDRSNLSIASCAAALAGPVPPGATARPSAVPVTALSGSVLLADGTPALPWQIEIGTVLLVGAGADQEAVEVLAVNPQSSPPTITAVFTRPHAAGAVVSLANVAGAPPVFLRPLAVEGPDPLPSPPYVPPLPYQVTVRVEVDAARSDRGSLAGRYEDLTWTIRPGTRLVLGVGPEQEVVTVEAAGFGFDRATATGTFRVAVTRPHADGFVLANTFLGNPGPQRRFDPRDLVFRSVVRYASVIE